MNIFQIQEDYLKLMQEIEDNDGVLDESMEERLYINENELQDKLKAYHHIIKMKNAEIGMIDEEVARLNTIKVVKENLIARLKKTVQTALLIYGSTGKTGNKQLKYDTLSIYNVYHKPVIIEKEEDFKDNNFINFSLNEKLTKEESALLVETLLKKRLGITQLSPDLIANGVAVSKAIDRVKLKKALSNGEEVDGAHLDEDANYIVIK